MTAQCAVEVSANRIGVNLKDTFEITTTGAAGVTDAFTAVHNYLQGNPTPTTGTRDGYTVITEIGVIGLGDYIDLESLSIAGYPDDEEDTGDGSAGFGMGKLTNAANLPLTNEAGESLGTVLRLMVVGINSFNGKNGNGTDPHLVFQFQNVPVTHRMNVASVNLRGYIASEARTYLRWNFQSGLSAAGVPFNQDWIWGPTRYVASSQVNDPTVDKITDKLWLPTEWEVFGRNSYSSVTYENEANQAWLGYYTSQKSRVKYKYRTVAPTGKSYNWSEASSNLDTGSCFCAVYHTGVPIQFNSGLGTGIAPAFCVK
jgi:hypothetical protein